MVNPTSLSASLSTAPSSLQHSSGVNHSSVTEEGCNDDPPPILSPPVGNSAGGVPSNQPDIRPGSSNKLSSYTSNVTIRSPIEDHQITTAPDGGHPESRVYDYGFSGKPILATAASSPMYESTPSAQSSTTAVNTITANSTVGSFDAAAPHAATPEAISSLLKVDLRAGLTSQEAKERLARDGLNVLTSDKGVTWWSVLLRQVSNSLTLVCILRPLSA